MNNKKNDLEVVFSATPTTGGDFKRMSSEIERVLPEQVIDEFDALGQREEMMSWEKGDKTNLIYDIVCAHGLKNERGQAYTFLDICFYVSVRFLNGTYSGNSVKAWAIVARRFPPATRRLYNYEDLPFSHFAYAAQKKFMELGASGKPKWKEILEYSVSRRGQFSKKCTVRELESRFEGVIHQKHEFVSAIQTDKVEYVTPVTVEDESELSLIEELEEAKHKIASLLNRIAAKFPRYTSALGAAYAALIKVTDDMRKVESGEDDQIENP